MFRGANADFNLTLAMALVFFAAWIVWGLREHGPVGFRQRAVRAKGREHRRLERAADRRVLRRRLPRGRFDPVPAGVAQLPALRQRVCRREHAGDDGRDSGIGWLVPVPFYFLELLVGLVQALVFMLLTAVFTLLICQHHEGEGAGAASPAGETSSH